MKKTSLMFSALAALFLMFPNLCSADLGPKSVSLTGTVTQISGSQITLTIASGALYYVESAGARLIRKYGADMAFGEIIVGDKLAVTGILLYNNNISASSIRDMSLYAHSGTFSGKISSVNAFSQTFVLQSKQWGTQTIHTDSFTSITSNGSPSDVGDLQVGMSATVKGAWDRSNKTVLAKSVTANLRLVKIYVTGILDMVNGSSLTMSGKNGAIYAIDVTGASLQNKTGQALSLSQFRAGDNLRVWGRHLSTSLQLTASLIKDSSITK